MESANSSPSEIIFTDPLDEYLLVEILKRLPVIALCRFQCVCKSWNSLISSEFFITHHFSLTDHPSLDYSNKSYLLFNPSYYPSFYSFYSPQGTLISVTQFPFQSPTKPYRDWYSGDPNFKVIDVIHGVICLSRSSVSSLATTILWNPTIHKYIMIPRSLSTRHWYRHPCDIGFGYDARKNDFKVVRIWHTFEDGYSEWLQPSLFEVFSTREGRWRHVVADHVVPFVLATEYSRFVNGVIHWIVFRQRCNAPLDKVNVLLMFDCEREEFTMMELLTYRGMLTVSVGLLDRYPEVWAMKAYGVASSWKKLDEDFTGPHEVGYVFEPSMFLMDVKSRVQSHRVELDEDDGNRTVEFIRDGIKCESRMFFLFPGFFLDVYRVDN